MGTDTNFRRIGFLLCLIVFLTEAACAGGSSRWRWAALGDSLTRRDGSEYPYRLAGGRFDLLNLADPGARLWDVVDDQLPRAVAARAQLVTIEVGTNDVVQPLVFGSAPNMSADAFLHVLDWSVAFLQLSLPGRVVVLGTLPPVGSLPAIQAWRPEMQAPAGAAISDYNRAITVVARRRGCRLWTFPELPRIAFHSDGFHPNRLGHDFVARTLAPLLPQGPAPAGGSAAPGPPPLTCFPMAGPPGGDVVLRGRGVDAVRRVVWFAPGGFRMCPVSDRQAGMLACSIPADARGPLDLWAIVTATPTTAFPNFLLGRFRVRSDPRPDEPRVGGVWLGVLTGPTGRDAAIRLDLDQAGGCLHGVAWVAERGRTVRRVATGSVRGSRVRLAFGAPILPGVTAVLRGEGRELFVVGAWWGWLRRW